MSAFRDGFAVLSAVVTVFFCFPFLLAEILSLVVCSSPPDDVFRGNVASRRHDVDVDGV